MDILDDIRVSKLSAKVFLKVNYFIACFVLFYIIFIYPEPSFAEVPYPLNNARLF